MRRRVLAFGLVLATGCSPAPDSAPAPLATAAPRTPTATHPAVARQATSPAMYASLPPGSCALEGYEAFFETLVSRAAMRPSLSAPGVDPATFRLAMRDSIWVDPATPDTTLDVREARDGDTFTAEAVPVERDESDEIVRTLGPAVRYRFRHIDGCWRYVGRR